MVDKVDETPGGDGQQTEPSSDVAAQPVIDAFGGIRPMASKLGVPVSTVQGWKQRDTIPAGRVGSIVAAAGRHGVALPQLRPRPSPAGPGPERKGGAGAASSGSPEQRRAGPRPGMRFGPSEDAGAREPQPMPAAQAVSSSGESNQVTDEVTETTSRAEPETAPPPPRGGGPSGPDQAGSSGGGRSGALIVAILALIVAVLWPVMFSQWLGADAQDGEAESLGALEERVATLEETPAGDVQQAVDALRAELESATGEQGSEAIQALTDRLEALEQAGAEGAATPAAVAQALESLQQTVDRLNQVVDGLQDRVATIEQNVAALEGAGGGAASDDLQAALESVRAAVDQIQADLDDVGQVADSARQQAVDEATVLVEQAVARLGERIDAVAGADDAAAEHQAFLLALGQLSSRLRTADAFADELEALKQVVANSESLTPALGDVVSQALAPLSDAAETGVPTLAGLQGAFDSMRRAVLNASGEPADDTLDEIWGEISGMVTVSRVDGAGEGTVDGILASAESHLAAGDLSGAVAALEGLEALGGGYAAAAAPWIAEAKLRLAADRAVETVYRAALDRFRPGPDAASASEPRPADSEPAD